MVLSRTFKEVHAIDISDAQLGMLPPNAKVQARQARAEKTGLATRFFDLITVAAEEIIEPAKNIPRAILISLVATVVIYLLVVFVTLAAVPPADGMPTWELIGSYGELGIVEAALDAELRYLGLRVERGIGLPIEYRDARLEHGYRIGMLVERKVIVECLALGHVAPVDTSRLLTYLRLMDLDVGLLFNFNTRSFAAGGIHRVHRPRPCPGAEHPPTTGANGRKASLPGYSSVNR